VEIKKGGDNTAYRIQYIEYRTGGFGDWEICKLGNREIGGFADLPYRL